MSFKTNLLNVVTKIGHDIHAINSKIGSDSLVGKTLTFTVNRPPADEWEGNFVTNKTELENLRNVNVPLEPQYLGLVVLDLSDMSALALGTAKTLVLFDSVQITLEYDSDHSARGSKAFFVIGKLDLGNSLTHNLPDLEKVTVKGSYTLPIQRIDVATHHIDHSQDIYAGTGTIHLPWSDCNLQFADDALRNEYGSTLADLMGYSPDVSATVSGAYISNIKPTRDGVDFDYTIYDYNHELDVKVEVYYKKILHHSETAIWSLNPPAPHTHYFDSHSGMPY